MEQDLPLVLESCLLSGAGSSILTFFSIFFPFLSIFFSFSFFPLSLPSPGPGPAGGGGVRQAGAAPAGQAGGALPFPPQRPLGRSPRAQLTVIIFISQTISRPLP